MSSASLNFKPWAILTHICLQEEAKLGIQRVNSFGKVRRFTSYSALSKMVDKKLEESQEQKAARLKEERRKRRMERKMKKNRDEDDSGSVGFGRLGSTSTTDFSRVGSANSNRSQTQP